MLFLSGGASAFSHWLLFGYGSAFRTLGRLLGRPFGGGLGNVLLTFRLDDGGFGFSSRFLLLPDTDRADTGKDAGEVGEQDEDEESADEREDTTTVAPPRGIVDEGENELDDRLRRTLGAAGDDLCATGDDRRADEDDRHDDVRRQHGIANRDRSEMEEGLRGELDVDLHRCRPLSSLPRHRGLHRSRQRGAALKLLGPPGSRRPACGRSLLQPATDRAGRTVFATDQRQFVELVPGGNQPEGDADQGQERGGVETVIEEDATTDAEKQGDDDRPSKPGHMTDGVDLFATIALVVLIVRHRAPPFRLRILSQSRHRRALCRSFDPVFVNLITNTGST